MLSRDQWVDSRPSGIVLVIDLHFWEEAIGGDPEMTPRGVGARAKGIASRKVQTLWWIWGLET